jgi:hypothetical protein
MKTIKMIAKIGDQKVPVGTCNSAQARILVRDDLAAWQDGDLILFIRQAHLALLDSNPGVWRYKDDDHNVSQAEMDRRKAWFMEFMPKAVNAATATPRGSIHYVPHTMTWSKVNPVGRKVHDPSLASEEPDEMGKEILLYWKTGSRISVADTSDMDALLDALDQPAGSDPFLADPFMTDDPASEADLSALWETLPTIKTTDGEFYVVDVKAVDEVPPGNALVPEVEISFPSDDVGEDPQVEGKDWMKEAQKWHAWYTSAQSRHWDQPPRDWDADCLIAYVDERKLSIEATDALVEDEV